MCARATPMATDIHCMQAISTVTALDVYKRQVYNSMCTYVWIDIHNESYINNSNEEYERKNGNRSIEKPTVAKEDGTLVVSTIVGRS